MAVKITHEITSSGVQFTNEAEWAEFIQTGTPAGQRQITQLTTKYKESIVTVPPIYEGNKITRITYFTDETTFNNFSEEYLTYKYMPDSVYNFLVNSGFTWNSTITHNVELP